MFLVDRGGQAQASIAVGEVGIELLDPDSFALDVLGDIMNGFGGRLFDELRSKEVRGIAGIAAIRQDLAGIVGTIFSLPSARLQLQHDRMTMSVYKLDSGYDLRCNCICGFTAPNLWAGSGSRGSCCYIERQSKILDLLSAQSCGEPNQSSHLLHSIGYILSCMLWLTYHSLVFQQ